MPPPSDAQLLRRCFAYLRPYWRPTAGVYLAMLAINAIIILTPQFIRDAIDGGIYGGDLARLNRNVALLLGVTVVKGVLIYFQGQWSEIASQSVAYDIRNAIVNRLAHLPFAWHNQSEAGQILSRAYQDVERIRFLTGRAVLRLVEGFFLLVMTAVTLFFMNTTLAALITLLLPLLLYRAYHFGRLFRPLSLQIQDQLAVLTTRVEQNLRGARIVKAFAQEPAENAGFQRENERWFNLAAESSRVEAVNAPLLDLIANAGTVLILGVGGWQVTAGQLTLGELVAFITYLALLVRPIRLIGRIIPMLAIAASAAERIFAILDAPLAIADASDAQTATAVQGHVRFENVSFTYAGHRGVLHDIDFAAPPGTVIALLGATGSGKTTLVNLIPRFYEPTAGRILLDGRELQDFTLRSLRRHVALVMQDPILFADTIRANIAFGHPDAPEEAVVQAARDAQAHDFITALPDGYDTVIGERGVTLSGGQKQRLAIARALITDPRILILDDATASVDSETEHRIRLALDRLMVGRTTFVIAHRLSTVRRADLILVLENGRIAARGTHDQLLQSSPLYRRVHSLQTEPDGLQEAPGGL